MSPHFFAHIIYILESIEIIKEDIKSSDRGLADRKTYDAVLYRLQTLSESASKLPDDIRASHPDVPWKRFSLTRNVIVHDYLGDSAPEEVMDFIETQLPILHNAMEQKIPNWKELRERMKGE